MAILVIFGAKYLIYLIVIVAAVAVFFNKEKRLKILYVAIVALPLGYALARLVGAFFSHQQPFAEQGFEPLIPHAVDNSFPSDHTLISGIFASLAFLADRRVGLALWALALLVGLARMLAGLHYGIDIAVAVALAAAAVWAAHRTLKSFGIY